MEKSTMIRWMAIFLMTGLTFAGCATAPQKDAGLDEANLSLKNAMNDEMIKQAAPEQLSKASSLLEQAKDLLDKGGSKEDVDHYVYLANQRIKIAEAKTQTEAFRKEIKKESDSRDKIILEAKQAKIEQLKQQLMKLKAKETNRGLVLTLGSVLFDLNKAELKTGGWKTISKVAEFMKNDPKRNVMIEGYTDSSGSLEYNEKLSLRRADSVRDSLVNQGINPQRVVTKGYGPKYPVASNKTAAGRQENRRVEIVFSDENGLFPMSR